MGWEVEWVGDDRGPRFLASASPSLRLQGGAQMAENLGAHLRM